MPLKVVTRRYGILSASSAIPGRLCHSPPCTTFIVLRHQSNGASHSKGPDNIEKREAAQRPVALARIPTLKLLRSLLLGAVFSSKILFTPSFAVMKFISSSRSRIIDPDNNPLLRAAVKPFIYDHFCAGVNCKEVKQTIADIKELGFAGVILCHGKEMQIEKSGDPSVAAADNVQRAKAEIDFWKQSNLETLHMVGNGDWIGVKYSGAGSQVTAALLKGDDPPSQFAEAMEAICQKAASQNCRLWADAEQQVLQTTIDKWTINFMRKYNRNGKALLYNTVQAYLKKSRGKLEHQLQLADNEGWTLGVKLVRGAYINNDIRTLIHDTKADTDASYNGICRDVISGNGFGFTPENFPKMALFLAGHNPITASMAAEYCHELAKNGQLKTMPDFGQLQGMADELGCNLITYGEDVAKESPSLPIAKVYKCVYWGSVRDNMYYLTRRAVENKGGTDAMKQELPMLKKEIWRRITNAMTIGRRAKTA